jgi:type IV secretory pathway VirB10-like protein
MKPVIDPTESPVFQRGGRRAVRVTQPNSQWNLALGLAVCVVLGVIAFASLSAGRQAKAEAGPRAATALAPPARPTFIAVPPPAPLIVPSQVRALPAPPATPADDPSRRWRSPVMVADLSDPSAAGPAPGAASASASAEPAAEGARSAEDRFAARVAGGGVETAHATRLRDTARVAPQGTVIPAVLETAINSDLPGSARAVVSQDVRGFDGSTVLIPRGSKLIGQYRSGVAQGQSRAFVVWSRILTPDGVSIDVGSPATDPLGRGGLAGETDTHFFTRFGGAILLTVLNVGVDAAVRTNGAGTAIIIGAPGQASPVTAVAPQRSTEVPVTVRVMQGTPLQVFVTRDLDFSTVAPRR